MIDLKTFLLSRGYTDEQLKKVPHLNDSGKISEKDLPSYVDDVLEGYYYNDAFYEDAQHTIQIVGEGGKIYVDRSSGWTYRWSGSQFIQIGGQDLSNYYTKDEAQAKIDSSHELDADLVDDTSSTHKFITANEKSQITTNQQAITNIKDGESIDSFADVESALNGKQGTINDLATIRSGASAGASAYQKPNGGIPKTDLTSDVQTSLGKADSAVQDNSYVHTDNNYTTTEKNKLAGLSNYDDTEVRGLITTETTRATNQENKSLYHLGAYDTVSGNTITRRTGYIDLGTLDYASNTDTYPTNSFYSVIVLTNAKSSENAKVSIDAETCFINSNGNLILIVNQEYASASAFKQAMQGVLLQYKLSTSYTEQVIDGESILPLDSNMSNKIRQEVVDGLNLFDIDSANWGTGYTKTATGISCSVGQGVSGYSNGKPIKNAFPFIKVGKTYTLTFTGVNLAIQEVYLYGSHFDWFSGTSHTFTQADLDDSFATYTNSGVTGYYNDIMIVESSHAYPYSSFNQKEHITNDEATLLKQEEEKCRNLTDNSIYGGQKLACYGYFNGTYVEASNGTIYWFETNLKANQNYTLSVMLKIGSVSGTAIYVLEYEDNTYAQGDFSSSLSSTYTLCVASVHPTKNVKRFFIGLYSYGNYVAVDTATVMLNKGTTALPYQPYKGSIVHWGEVPFENIVDKNGNKRFIEGSITTPTITGVTFSYTKWSLSGSHLMIVLAGAVNQSIPSQQIATITLPNWIYDKIYQLSSAISSVVTISNMILRQDDAITKIKTYQCELAKADDVLKIFAPAFDEDANEAGFRVQFDLIIDND